MMSLPDKTEIERKIDRFFWNTRNVLGPSFDDVIADVGLSKKPNRPHRIPVNVLLKILERLNVTLDSLMDENIDFECMKLQFSGEDSLPMRYLSRAPLSSRYTSISMMNFIKKEFGEETSNILMKHFQLRSCHFQHPGPKNNFFLPMDLCNYVYKFFGAEMVELMGKNSVDLLRCSPDGLRMKNLSSTKEMLDFFFSEVAPKSVEKNYFWKIEKHQNTSMLISGTPNPEIKEAFGSEDDITHPSAVLQRKGFIKGLFQIQKTQNLSIETSRIFKSNKLFDLYHIEYHQTSLH